MTVAELRAFIAVYCTAHPDLDAYQRKVIARLISDEGAWCNDVAAVFALVPAERREALLIDCLTAEEKIRTHATIVAAARERLKKAAAAEKGLASIRRFINEIEFKGGEDIVAEAIHEIAQQIRSERDFARLILLERSRKTDHPACRAEAIGWLAESLLRSTGKPNRSHVAVLASALLGEEISANEVRNAIMPREALEGVNRRKLARSRRK